MAIITHKKISVFGYHKKNEYEKCPKNYFWFSTWQNRFHSNCEIFLFSKQIYQWLKIGMKTQRGDSFIFTFVSFV